MKVANRPVHPILRAAIMATRPGWRALLLASAVLNLLALAGSLYLLLIYNRILPSASLPTLAALFAILLVVYAFNASADMIRLRLLHAMAQVMDDRLAPALHRLELDFALDRRSAAELVSPTQDLEQLRRYLSSLGPAALIDLPWVLFFLLILFLMHPLLGATTLISAAALYFWSVRAERGGKNGVREANQAARVERMLIEQLRRSAEAIRGLALSDRMAALLHVAHRNLLERETEVTRHAARSGGVGRTGRLIVQALVLSVGAWLVIEGRASAGIIFAGSLLAGRALAPIDQTLSNLRAMSAARQAFWRLNDHLSLAREVSPPSVALPAPQRNLVVENLVVVPPGSESPVLRGVNFAIDAGTVLGVLGASGSGKSSLVKAIVGAWPRASGTIRLDGADTLHWNAEQLQLATGYLPQTVELLSGTIAQNIAGFEDAPPSETVLAASTAADVHDFILRLENGYDQDIGVSGQLLSGGQRQRIGLARALYRDPFLVVLDEPDANLDPDGQAALTAALRVVSSRGGIAVVVSHHLTLIGAMSHVLVLREGRQEAFGPTDQVMTRISGPREVPAGDRSPATARRAP